MTEALILNRFLLSRVPYRAWLPDGARIRMITSPGAVDVEAGIEDTHVVADYDTTGQVEDLAVALYRERPYAHIVALSEYDILRAARLREFLGLPGQDYQSALAFRDKVVMKDYWTAASLPVTPYTAVDTATDLLEFTARHGFPVVVKPRRAAGSRGVSVLHDHHQLSEWLRKSWSMPLSGISGWMAEKFVDGQMMHVDGLLVAGALEIAWPSTTTSQLAFHDGHPSYSVQLHPADPAVAEARAIVEAALSALPCPGLTIFHAEIWRLSDNTLVLNEIASRLGGGKIRATVAAAFGTDMAQRYVQGTLMPECLAADIPAPAPRRAAGFVIVPPGRGTVVSVAAIPGWLRDTLAEASVTARPGQTFNEPAASAADTVAACVATGSDHSEVKARLESFVAWSRLAISYRC